MRPGSNKRHDEKALNSLRKIHKLKLPKIVKGDIYLNKLLEYEELILPEIVEGDLYLNNIKDFLKLPQTVLGSIYFNYSKIGLDNKKIIK